MQGGEGYGLQFADLVAVGGDVAAGELLIGVASPRFELQSLQLDVVNRAFVGIDDVVGGLGQSGPSIHGLPPVWSAALHRQKAERTGDLSL